MSCSDAPILEVMVPKGGDSDDYDQRQRPFTGLYRGAGHPLNHHGAADVAPEALGEATARAVQRIPDAHCNGDMHAALQYATDIKHRQKDFLDRQGIDALLDD